ncbi:MAG TPA: FYDLN acid domain-containing protein [Thermoanaerobaculia bacterium]|nr:FYDLN acid domain-containing protein [Thermoanaerobaculia bacterium]
MADLGQRHECSECGAKYYDLGKADPVCPRCGTPVAEAEEGPRAAKSRRKRRAPTPAKERVVKDEALEGPGDETLDEDDDFEAIPSEDLEDDEIEDFEEEEEADDEDEAEA